MRKEVVFKPVRFYLLLRNAVLLNKSAIGLVSGAFAAILLFISAIDALAVCTQGLHQRLYLGILYLGGLIVTGRIFRELHDKVRGPAWLLVPASVLEKICSRIALSTVVYVACSMLMYFVFSMISETFNWLTFSRHHALFNPFEARILKGAALYVVLQSPFLAGAIYFRKHALSKTVLVLLGYFLVFSLVVFIGTRLIFGGFLDGLIPALTSIFQQSELDSHTLRLGAGGIGGIAVTVGRIVFWVFIPLLCWTICYFRLKETER